MKPSESRRLLLVAFHFPPFRGSSGFHRTLAFTKYLAEFGWGATVLTVNPGAHELIRDEYYDLIPPQVEVIRAPALDAGRHLAIGGRYPRFLALPDRWQSWIPGGILRGLARIRQGRIDAIFSTFPIASAHIIGLALHRLTGLPWVADLRDPMDQVTYPADPRVRRAFRWVEERVFREANRVLVTTPGTAALYCERYGALAAGKIAVIPNGYDPETFPEDFHPESVPPPAPGPHQPLLLLHSGKLYPSERDPRPFFNALAALRNRPGSPLAGVRVVLRATGHDRTYRPMIDELGLGDVVTLAPSVPYKAALEEMLGADVLLLFQGKTCDRQIPAKAYEYLFAGRPILGITSPDGDTGQLLRSVGIQAITPLEDSAAIAAALEGLLADLRSGRHATPPYERVARLSRHSRTAELARLLDELAAKRPGEPVPAAARDN